MQRLDQREHHGGGGIVGFNGGVRGLFRGAAGSAVHRRDAGRDQRFQNRVDRITRWPLSFRPEFKSSVRRGGARRQGNRRPLSDQFTNAERATDWRGNNNIAESIYVQMREEKHPTPEWIVVGAGTGGTSATIGRYIRYRRHATRLCVVDPENSAFFPAYSEGRYDIVMPTSSRIEGIGRPRVEPSFLPGVVDRMVAVPDAASIAAARHVSAVLGRRVGPSTGTNLWGAFGLLAEMVKQGRSGSVVTLLADSGDRYADTYFSDEWVSAQGLDPAGPAAALVEFERSCRWT